MKRLSGGERKTGAICLPDTLQLPLTFFKTGKEKSEIIPLIQTEEIFTFFGKGMFLFRHRGLHGSR